MTDTQIKPSVSPKERSTTTTAVAGFLLRVGFSPNAITIGGSALAFLGAVIFAPHGYLIAGTIVVAIGIWTDSIDGTMARMSGRTSDFGAFLDSFLDRLVDGSIYASLAYWLFREGHSRVAMAALAALISSYLVSYARARAEGLGYLGEIGYGHRFTRLEITGVGTLLAGFGVPYVLEIALWALCALALTTVVQRVAYVRRQVIARQSPML